MKAPRVLALITALLVSPKAAIGQMQAAPDTDDPFAEEISPIPNAQPSAKTLPSPQPPRLRLRIATGISQTYGSSQMQWPDGTSVAESCSSFGGCGFRFALGGGIDWSPARFFGLGVHARWLVGRASWEEYLGRHLDIVEVLLVPRLELPWKWRWPPGGARPYLALPFGPAWSYESRTWSRAVAEDWNSRTGLSAGFALGMEFYWRHRWGWFVELNYQKHVLPADVTQTPVDEPQARVTERISVKEADLILSVGLLFGLDR